ncbi:MAG: hypothetical protein KatS3mg033_0474 [Thermonema sp.]|uniref:GH3 auxin-responsive promoter family protein n=1 Tax=Thermonema sp. TaxID=2231181 RepID=UPI0021DEA397|nr:GH3 auxin-responsive promoter family protein [Thermonema sp.]GIV38674.1 MAG: hypothetical protein KatS3mg033_0474 [Thermonema sp.]
MLNINRLASWWFRPAMRRIRFFMEKPALAQDFQLRHLLHRAQKTEWGKRYGFKEIKHYDTFRERIPVSSYEQLYPFIERMMQGERDVLWPGQVRWFAKSSGTTNDRSKYIPVPKESLHYCHFQGGKDLLTLYLENTPDTRVFNGKALSIGGTHHPHEGNSRVRVGDVSAVIMQNLPAWAQWFRAPSLQVALLADWEEKIQAMIRELRNSNITAIMGVPTWTVVLLEELLKSEGKQYVQEIWQQFEVFFHGAVAFAPYRPLFERIAPGLRFMEVYNASEGFFALQDDLSRDDMLLMLDYGVFYEFIPMDELGKDHPKAYWIDEVEMGKNYAMVISTNGGLWRYLIGDTVQFTSLYPHRIKITGRTKQFINAFGEEVMVENAERAIAFACEKTGAAITDYTVAPVYLGDGNKGAHEWLIEFASMPHDLHAFGEALDRRLREINSDYDAKRQHDLALTAPLIRVLPQGTFQAWMKKRGKLGGQHKVPRLANHRQYVNDIYRLLGWEIKETPSA